MCPTRETEMIPCEQADKIEKQGKLLEDIARAQKDHRTEFQQSIQKLTDILIENTKHDAALSQARKELDLLFDKTRTNEHRIEAIEMRNARCDGAGIFESWPKIRDFYLSFVPLKEKTEKLWNKYQQDEGVKKWIPLAISVIAILITLLSYMDRVNNHSHSGGSNASVQQSK